MSGGDRGEESVAPWGARVLALLALIAAAVVSGAIVAGSLAGSDEDATDGPRQGAGRTVEGCTPSEPGALRDGYYVVQPGEPGLSAVADKTCVPVERLIRLNENLDPQLIPQGACVNLRRDGCQALAES